MGNYFPKKSNRQQGIPSRTHSGVLAILIEGLEACYPRRIKRNELTAHLRSVRALAGSHLLWYSSGNQGGDCDQWGSW